MTELRTLHGYKLKPEKVIVAKVKTPSQISGTIRCSLKGGYVSPKYVTTSEGERVVFGDFIDSRERMWKAVEPVIPKIFGPPSLVLPSLHLFLGPFYVLLGIMSCVLAMDILYFLNQTTTIAFYTILGDLGPTLTIVGAIIFVWRVYQKYKRA